VLDVSVLYVGMFVWDGDVVVFGGWVFLVVGIGVDLMFVCICVYEVFVCIYLDGG